MQRILPREVVMLAILGWVLAATGSEALSQVVTGTARYRERMALPPGAVFEATLEDISRAGAPAEVLGTARLEPAGQPPFRFAITYDPRRIQPERSYAVRARVSQEGRLFFSTDRLYPVLTRGHGNFVQMLLLAGPAKQPPLGKLPATFAGQLPCADCEGIRWHLDLLPDHTFQLRLTYLGKPQELTVDDIGCWRVAGDGRALHLAGGGGTRESFEILNPETLRKLDRESKPVESSLNYDLKRSREFAPLEPQLAMTGMYTYLADTGLLTLCATGWKLPVASEGDNAALEAAYGKERRKPGEPVLVSLKGRIVARQPLEGAGPRPTVVVDRFEEIRPGETCRSPFSTAKLQETYWKLTRLNEAAVQVGPKQRVPHLLFHSKKRRFSGFGGCNRIMGRYHIQGKTISFEEVAMTKMACPEEMKQERDFVDALQRVRSWNISGQHLDLLDASGAPVARFEAAARRP